MVGSVQYSLHAQKERVGYATQSDRRMVRVGGRRPGSFESISHAAPTRVMTYELDVGGLIRNWLTLGFMPRILS